MEQWAEMHFSNEAQATLSLRQRFFGSIFVISPTLPSSSTELSFWHEYRLSDRIAEWLNANWFCVHSAAAEMKMWWFCLSTTIFNAMEMSEHNGIEKIESIKIENWNEITILSFGMWWRSVGCRIPAFFDALPLTVCMLYTRNHNALTCEADAIEHMRT